MSCDPAALGWNPRFACCWSLGHYSSLCCLLPSAMKLLQLQRFSVFPLSSTDFSFPNILIKYCCCGLGVSGLGAPPTTSVPQFSFCTEQNMVWKPLLCDSRVSWGLLWFPLCLRDCFVHSQCSTHRNVVLRGSIPCLWL